MIIEYKILDAIAAILIISGVKYISTNKKFGNGLSAIGYSIYLYISWKIGLPGFTLVAFLYTISCVILRKEKQSTKTFDRKEGD